MHHTIIIRQGKTTDVPALLSLVKELALFERAPDEVTITLDAMLHDGFGPEAVYKVHVAEVDGTVVGMAIFYTAYSTWKGKYIYLEDLYVQEFWRGKAIGRKLFDSVAAYAASTHSSLLKWQVLDWNNPAIEFYKSYGAIIENEWLNGKLTKEQLSVFKHKPIFTEL